MSRLCIVNKELETLDHLIFFRLAIPVGLFVCKSDNLFLLLHHEREIMDVNSGKQIIPLSRKLMNRNKIFKDGIKYPLVLKNTHFDFEVVEVGELEKVEHKSSTASFTCQKLPVLLQSLGGPSWACDQFYCTFTGDDAVKQIRPGDIISADLHFLVFDCGDGTYQQRIYAHNVLTVNDFYQMHIQND